MNSSLDPGQPMILESIVVSANASDEVNIAPMGPMVDRQLTHFVLQPFATSTTYRNLKETSACVIHVCDDVLLMARAAIGKIEPLPTLQAIEGRWWMLPQANRWFAVEVTHWANEDSPRPRAECKVRHQGSGPPCFGFNRGKHAVVEAAILATRVGLIDPEEIRAQWERLRVPLEKTGGTQERQAFELLERHIAQHLAHRDESI